MKIVLADDSSLLRDRIKSLLNSINNVSVVGEAENGVEALRLIMEKEPDLAILDIRMPEMNGIEVLKKIREIGLRTKVCILTNYPYKQYREKCLSAGAEYFFDKNQSIDELMEVVSTLANKQEGA
ncbi:MAG: response regulator transcription factor [Bacteroidales bacterium]|jgi:DNA-binding NarL/FixJ family response regulator